MGVIENGINISAVLQHLPSRGQQQNAQIIFHNLFRGYSQQKRLVISNVMNV